MRRRQFIGLLGGVAVAFPRTTRAAGRVYRIALVHPALPVSELTETTDYPGWPALLKELRRLGYVEGDNLVLLRFTGGGDTAHYDSMVRDVVGAAPDLIILTSVRLALLFKAATSTIPVVGSMLDPVGYGVVTSIAHPDGNITGVSNDAGPEIWGKRLAILLEAVPTAKRVGALVLESSWDGPEATAFREAAQHLSVSIVGSRLKGMTSEVEYRRVFATLEQEQAQGLIVFEQNTVQRRLIVELAEKARLPVVYPYRVFVQIRIAILCGGLFAAVRFSESMRKHAQSGSRYSMLKSTDVSEARRWFAEDLRVSSPVARNPAIVEAFAKETGRHFTS